MVAFNELASPRTAVACEDVLFTEETILDKLNNIRG